MIESGIWLILLGLCCMVSGYEALEYLIGIFRTDSYDIKKQHIINVIFANALIFILCSLTPV
jgi:hypothetical protein